MRKEKAAVDVEFKAKGLGGLKAGWLDFAGELLEPVVLLAAGATKAEAAWAGLRGTLTAKVLGPLVLVAGAATAFLLTTRKLIGEWKHLGMGASKQIESLTLQFKPLLKSMDLARKMAKDVFDFGAKTPFTFPDTAAGAKMLQSLTKGQLNNKQGWELVGDAAAVAGESFEATSRYVGRLYDGLMNGRPVGEAAMRLQELGIITGQTRNQIDSMQAANASGNEIWKVVSKDVSRAKGAMKDMEQTLAALESQYSDVQMKLQSGFSDGFMEGEKAGIKASIEMMEKMTPVAQYFGEMFGTVSNAIAEGKKRLQSFVTSVPGFEAIVKLAAGSVLLLAGSIVAMTGAALGKFLLGVISSAQASRQLAAASVSAAQAQAVELAVTKHMTAAKVQLVAAKTAVIAGSRMETLVTLKSAAASTVAAFRTNAWAASQMLLRGALVATLFVGRMVLVQLKEIAVATLKSPVAWVIALGAAMLHLYNSQKKAREEMEAFARSTRSLKANLESVRAGIMTLNDLLAAESQAVSELASAYAELEDARRRGSTERIEQAQERVDVVAEQLRKTRDTPQAALAKNAEVMEREEAIRRGEKEKKASEREFGAKRGAESELEAAKEIYEEREKAVKTAEDAIAAEEALAAKRQEMNRNAADTSVKQEGRREELAGRRASLEVVVDKADDWREASARKAEGSDMTARGWREALGEDVNKNAERAELAKINAELADMDAADSKLAVDSMNLGLESGSELAVLQEKVRLRDDLAAATVAEAAAVAALADAEAEGKGVASMKSALDLVRDRKAQLEMLGKKAGVDGDFNKQDAETRIGQIKEERNEAVDPSRLEEARQRLVDAEMAAADARLDGEGRILTLRLKGYEREEKLLGIEEARLEVRKKRDRIDQAGYDQAKAEFAERRAAMGRESAERGKELGDALRISKLRREEAAARDAGDQGKADTLRAKADAIDDERTRIDAVKDAEGFGGTAAQKEAFVQDRVDESQRGREQERAEQEKERSMGRRRSEQAQESVIVGMEAGLLKRRGGGKDAKAMVEAEARKKDELDREEAKKRFIGQGFGEQEAGRLADREVKTSQAERMIADLGGQKGTIVASSLAKMGGGGGVSGTDTDREVLEKIAKILEQIRDDKESDIDFPVK